MFVRLHVNAKDENNLKEHLAHFIKKFDTIIEKVTLLEIEEYWKFEDMFEVVYEFKLQDCVTYSDFYTVLQTVSDYWLVLGTEQDRSLLASKNAEECHFILENIELVKFTQISNLF